VNAAADAVCQRAARQQDTGGDMADLGGLDPNDPEDQPTVQQLLNDLERIRAISGLNALLEQRVRLNILRNLAVDKGVAQQDVLSTLHSYVRTNPDKIRETIIRELQQQEAYYGSRVYPFVKTMLQQLEEEKMTLHEFLKRWSMKIDRVP
jgi:hypothetical protein